jgi:hypothetical protein
MIEQGAKKRNHCEDVSGTAEGWRISQKYDGKKQERSPKTWLVFKNCDIVKNWEL